MRTILKIVKHHSADPSEEPQFETINRHHKQQWGRGMEYHMLIERNGNKVLGMPEEEIGYHAGNYPINEVSLGICIAGDLRYQTLTQAQFDSFFEVVMKWQNIYQIPDSELWLHREVRLEPTECPVIDLRDMYLARKYAPKDDGKTKEKDLKKRLKRAENGLKYARGRRRKLLDRLIMRIKKFFRRNPS